MNHRLPAIAAFVVATILLGCGSNSWCPPWGTAECNVYGSGGSPASCGEGLSLWECNVVGGPNTVPVGDEHDHSLGASCGSFYCALSEADAETQTGAAGDPSLSCASVLPTWTSCISSSCNACDDGAGGMLQSSGEHCAGDDAQGTPPGGYSCCHGLTCEGATASEMGYCAGTLSVCAMKPPVLIPLTTTRLRAIAAAQGIGVGQMGVQQNRTIGLAFENWVLTMLGQIPRNQMPFFSMERQTANNANGGLPKSVIPEFVSPLALFFWGGSAPAVLQASEFWEVKAVTGILSQTSNRSQILGLIDVASQSPAGVSTIQPHPPPTVVFTTTGNTYLSQSVFTTATSFNVAIWQQVVFVDDAIPNDPNPDLYIGQLVAMNPSIYGSAIPVPSQPSGAHSKLTSPTTPPMSVPDDPDPPEVD
jgi:hypothetical protein